MSMLPQIKLEDFADERSFLKSVAADVNVPVDLPAPRLLHTHLSLSATFRSEITRVATVTLRGIRTHTQQEIARCTAFLFVPVWLGIGAVLYFIAGFEPNGMVLLSFLLAMLALRFLASGNRTIQVCATILLFIALGATSAKLQSWRNSTPMLAGEITTVVTARIVSLNKTAKSHRAVLDIINTEKPALKYAPQRIRITMRDETSNLQAGDIIQVKLRLMPPSGPVRPTSYDFAFQSYFDGIGATGFSIGPVSALEDNNKTLRTQMTQSLEKLRQTIAVRIRNVLSGSEAEIAVALIAGVQSGIDEDTMETLRITGLAHVLSISGLHMALVAGLFMGLVRGGMALFPNQAAKVPVKKYAAFLALVACFFYLLLSGADVAAMRAFLMLSVFLVAVLFDQQALTMRNLAISAIAILLVTPHEVMGPSFQMSFAATAALISAYAYWSNRSLQYHRPAPQSLPRQALSKCIRFLLGLGATSLIAGLATSLYSAWHFHRVAPMGLPTNLSAMPPVSLVVMPFAVLSAIAMPFGLEEWPLRAMGAGIKVMLAIANYFASISPEGVSGAIKPAALIASTCTLLIACLMQTRLKWLAVLPVALSFALGQPHRPDVLISEDAKLVAVRTSESILSVNRDRPNAFTMQAWQRAVRADIATPSADMKGTPLFMCKDNQCPIQLATGLNITWLGYPKAQKRAAGISNVTQTDGTQTGSQEPGQPFFNREATLAILAAKFDAAARAACGETDLLILEGPVSKRLCAVTDTQVISARDLALYGSAEIHFNNDIKSIVNKADSNYELSFKDGPAAKSKGSPVTKPTFQVTYAIGNPNRPWNAERRFSRAARNMPPFQPLPQNSLVNIDGLSQPTGPAP